MATISISIPEIPPREPGQSVTVPINVDDATGIAGASITITFDSTILSATDVSETELTSNFQLESNFVAGEVRISMAKAAGLTGGSGTIALITLKNSDTTSIGSTSELAFSKKKLYGENAEALDVNAVDGTFTVGVPPITVTVSGSPAKSDETITVIVTTESSGGSAQFSIEGIVSDVEMTENPQKAGEYTGTYTAVKEDNVQDVPVTIVFTTSAGNSVTDSSQAVTIKGTREFTLKLSAGINLISVPLKPEIKMKLSDLAAYIGDVSLIIWHNPDISEFVSYVPPSVNVPANTVVEGGRGYIVIMKTPKEVTFEGMEWDGNVISLSAGANLISVLLKPETEMKLSDFAAYIGDVSLIVWHNPDTSEFVSYVPPSVNIPANTVVEGGRGYIVVMKTPKEVVFEGIAWENTPSTATP